VGLCVEERERRAPGAAEDHVPVWDLQVDTEGFNVSDEVLGGVFAQLGGGRGFAGAALVEEDDPVVCWVEVDGVFSGGVAAGAAMEEDYCGWVTVRTG
jgi:hypothetical protein